MKFEMPDPRGVMQLRPALPASRLGTLEGARLLLVDNGKLAPAYGSHRIIAEVLPEMFGEASWSTFARDFLKYHHTEIAGLVDEILRSAPQAAVFALADAGVSVQTMLAATELEKLGVPTVVLATGVGTNACHCIARPRLPALPIVTLDIARSDGAEDVRAALLAARPSIVAALTKHPETEAVEGDPTGALGFNAAGTLSDFALFQDWLEANGLGDGLPLLPPLPDTVAALLVAVAADPEEVLYEAALTSGRSLRVRDAAVNAAMTGCPPAAFPVVVAALRAVAKPDFRLLQAAITTHPSGYFVLLSGDDPARFGLSGGPGCLGPGHRGNLAVGRAVSLTIQHLFGARPGGADLTVFGSPAEIAYCMAEEPRLTPWPALASERGFNGPAVLVIKAEGPRNVMEHLAVTPRAICEAIAHGATSQSANSAYVPGDLAVLLNPEHAEILVRAGWSRRDLAQAIHMTACLPREALEGRGVAPIRPPYMDALDLLPVTRSPEDVHIVVGGAIGPHSMVALPWGFSRGQWMPVIAS